MSDPVDLRLVSNFREPYDHHFASRHRTDLPEWRRMSTTERTRAFDLSMLEQSGLTVVPHGTLASFAPENMRVVAYLDPWAHRGAGKRLDRARDILADGAPATTHASAFIGSLRGRPRSLRVVGFGRFFWWLIYRGERGEWRSNVGEAEVDMAYGYPTDPVRVHAAIFDLQARLAEPLVAVDFVEDRDGAWGKRGEWFACDLATAPGIQGTPIAAYDLPGGLGMLDLAQSIEGRWREVHGLPFRKEKA